MKRTSVFIAVLVMGVCLPSLAKETLSVRLERAIAQAQQTSLELVHVTATLQKPVYMSDVMFRRPRCKDEIVSYQKKKLTCKGRLSQSGHRVYVPVACVSAGDYKLSEVVVTLADGRVLKGTQNSVAVSGQVAYVRLPEHTNAR